ncbi:hypothetical protein K3175_05740 [Qipengyuania sp. GH1]|uniref:hypothetical protein n=1 Tax=Qipengyuania aestuarii TaxID=2867241 RepID=UPI001C88DD31|nr:hypothetical protein [Qipengyuania aestuarii]MBX7535155.1 hypothetical protein [Qipengyuania aestuarii]
MLDLCIGLNEISRNVEGCKNIIGFYERSLNAFESPHLHVENSGSDEGDFYWIGEGRDPFAATQGATARMDAYRSFVDYEGIAICVRRDPGGAEVIAARTYTGTSPIYVAIQEDRLVITWRYEQAVAALIDPRPNLTACKIFIDHGATRIRDQVIESTFNFWPGEEVHFNSSGLTFKSAPERDILGSTPVLHNANISKAFTDLLSQQLSRFRTKSKKSLVEVSGGLDSSLLAIVAATSLPEVYSYGLLQVGIAGDQQALRRRELIELVGLKDSEANANAFPPFAGLRMDESSISAFDDNHRPACVKAIDALGNAQFDLLIAGIGGDELMMENTYTSQEWEVPGTVCTSSVVAGCARADMFMRRGIWAINPLCSPTVIDFCRALPREFRHDRFLMRTSLIKLGLSDAFVFPRLPEHYGALMRHEMAFVDVEELLGDGPVSDFEMMNLSSLFDECRSAYHLGFSYPLIGRIWNAAKLNAVLRRYLA